MSKFEVPIPKEIRDYTESLFMGLNLKQCIMCGIAIALAVPIFVLLRPKIGLEPASWICLIVVAPIGATAFVKIKGLPLLEYAIAFVKWYLTPNNLVYKQKNAYMEALKQMRAEEHKKSLVNRKEKHKKKRGGLGEAMEENRKKRTQKC